VVDGVSWRILLEDIATLQKQYQNKEGLSLPLKTDPYQLWSDRLAEYAKSVSFDLSKVYWQKIEGTEISSIPRDFEDGTRRNMDAAGYTFALSEKDTGDLLTKVNEAFNTEINDILLTCLALGINDTFGVGNVPIEMEGHGREEIFEGVNITRTVGWFTSIYPIILDVSLKDDLSGQIKAVKEYLRKIPDNGIGYGIYRYLTDDFRGGALHPQVGFNYLGQIDGGTEELSLSVTGDPIGDSSDPAEDMEFEIGIEGMVSGGRLSVRITYSREQYREGTFREFGGNYQKRLEEVIAFCRSRDRKELTPSDLTYKQIPISRLEELQGAYGVEDIYPLSPMQEGMLFHSLADRDSQVHFEQMVYHVHGSFETGLVQKGFEILTKRHDILRTVFIADDRP
jgi:non-ribosomal peptide synthase protein (TIGR01720 family)